VIRVLHAGCGRAPLPEWLTGQEVRLDIDPDVSPDFVAPLTAMGDIGQYEIAYCSHALEHLAPHDIDTALAEFHRVIRPGGFLIAVVPNLADVKPTLDVVYESPAGPITGLDMYYGKASFVKDNPYMAHKFGFVRSTFEQFLERAGFTVKHVSDSNYNLMATAQR
jgi:predicted SAM-dependent methyltransferase